MMDNLKQKFKMALKKSKLNVCSLDQMASGDGREGSSATSLEEIPSNITPFTSDVYKNNMIINLKRGNMRKKHCDFVRTMTDEFENELDDSYQLNVAFSKKLAGKVNNLRQYTMQKTKKMVRENLDRLRGIRDGSSWKKDIKNLYNVLEKDKAPTKESDAHIRLSFKKALLQKTETDAFQNRLRIDEVQTLLRFKKDLDEIYESPWGK